MSNDAKNTNEPEEIEEQNNASECCNESNCDESNKTNENDEKLECSTKEDEEEICFDSISFESLTSEMFIKYQEYMENKINTAILKEKDAEDKFLRTHADFDNIKKRLEREKYQAIDYASEKFAKDLLSPIDTLDMAISSTKSDATSDELLKKLTEGIELTIKTFQTTFEKNNIEIVEVDNFDPELHNAVMKVDSENHETGEIVEVMQKGYKMKDRLLRPAMVSIAN